MGDHSDESPPPEPTWSRQTSFARSFFQAGGQHAVLSLTGDDDGDGVPSHAAVSLDVPISRSRPLGRPRVLSGRSTTRAGLTDALRASSAAAGGRPLNVYNDNHTRRRPADRAPLEQAEIDPPPPPLAAATRQESWYRDALEQGMSEENLQVLVQIMASDDPAPQPQASCGADTLDPYTTATAKLAPHEPNHHDAVQNTSLGSSTPDGFDDHQVLEQYRIMAHLEARQLVQERLGVDVTELREQHASKPASAEAEPPFDCPRPPMTRPTVQRPLASSAPPRPLPELPARQAMPRPPLEPQLQIGQLSDTGHTVCLGCGRTLEASRWASLVQCAACAVMSPNTAHG